MTSQHAKAGTISVVVSDVDGTLVRTDKSLSPHTVAAVAKLRNAGIAFSIVSSRPPRGLAGIIQSLGITGPVAGFNGGVIASPSLSVITRHLIEPDIARRAVQAIEASGASAWVFSGDDWFLRSLDEPRVTLEQRTVGFSPTVVDNLSTVTDTAAKIVAVSDDAVLLTRLQEEVRASLSKDANIVRSQPYYLDVTHPLANKGHALQELTRLMGVPTKETAVLGDGANDVDLFSPAALSIAMGNASADVKESADFVTGGNNDDGWVRAIDWFVLGGHRTPLEGTSCKVV